MCAGCRSRRRRICASTTRWASSPCRATQIARIHGSSGTTGKPTFVAYTKNDLELWADLCARFLVAGGLRPEHLCQIAFGYGLFTGGFGLNDGIEKVGAADRAGLVGQHGAPGDAACRTCRRRC